MSFRDKNKSIYLLILFLTGATSLIYQILWIREFALFFGVHIYSLSIVLSAFMAGLAIGSYFLGKLADRFPAKAALIFFFIQFALGLFALFFSNTLALLTDAFVFITRALDANFTIVNLIRPIFAFSLLLLPASLMGGVIPVISKIYVDDIRQVGRNVSLLYFINNAGAVIGCFMAGFVLVAYLGTQTTFYITASVNFTIGIIGLIYYFTHKRKHVRPSKISDIILQSETKHLKTPLTQNNSRKLIKIALWVFAVEGFTTLAYQVLWTRLLIEFSFEKTIYFTTIIIMSSILGLALGGLCFYRIEKRIQNHYKFLGVVQVLAGASSLLLFIIFNKLAPELVTQRVEISSYAMLVFREYLFTMMLLFIPTFFTGITFPLISKMYSENLDHMGTRIGIAGMLDTAGSIFGSLIAGFLLLPWLGIYFSFVLIVFINILLGLLVFNTDRRTKNTWVYNVALPVLLALVLLYFSPGKYYRLQEKHHRNDITIFRKEGIAATIRVNLQPSGHYALVINGAKTAFTNDDDLRVHKMLAYLPYWLGHETRTAYVIGFGMGVTSATLANLDVDKLQVADICPELLVTANFFSPFNRDITESPIFSFVPEDGRSYLIRTNETFDIITSNAVHARLNANLYTREFYQIAASRLNPGGVIAQWVPTNWLTAHEFRSLINAFTEVFEYAQLWHVTRGHVILVGGDTPLLADYRKLENLFRNREVMTDLTTVGINNPQKFAANLLLTTNDLKAFSRGSPINTDDLPLVEFSREIDLKPNATILDELSRAEPVFERDFNFDGYSAEELHHYILPVIKAENTFIRENLRIFVNTFGKKKKN